MAQWHHLVPDSLQVAPELGSRVHSTRDNVLVFIFGGKVESPSGEGSGYQPEGRGSLLLGDGTQAAYNALAFAYLPGLADRVQLQPGDTTGWEMATAAPPDRKSLMKNTVASVILKGEKKWETAGLGL